jgi:ribosomal protein S18 acetylase RimI-like enzyme
LGRSTILIRQCQPVSDEEYYIEHLAVLPELRGQGIGKQLMEFAENQARAKGLKRLALDVEIENEGARRFYKRLGFQQAKVVTAPSYCKRFNFQGSIRMAKAIAKSER